jgi:bifunctional DNase/RNase
MSKIHGAQLAALILLVMSSVMAYAIINMTGIDKSGYVIANVIRVSDSTIVIGNNCTAIVADTTDERAQSIESGIMGVVDGRPTTHDTFVEVLKSFNITLDYVNIERYDGRNYYANLILSSGEKTLKLDTRPSDALALAVRTNSTVYINSTMLREIGRNICG